jgi:hypothetical protein
MNNKNRKFVKVPQVYVDRGRQYGIDICAHYAAGGSPMSRSRSGNRGTESNPILQAHGKIGEAAVALYLGLDVETAVKWAVSEADHGTDIWLPNGARVDVKTTLMPFKLIWSNNVNDLYYQKAFDVLVSVSIDERDWSCCYVEGWITKDGFYHHKQIADGVNSRLEVGTWFIDKSVLSNIDDLPHLPQLTKHTMVNRVPVLSVDTILSFYDENNEISPDNLAALCALVRSIRAANELNEVGIAQSAA